MKNMDIIKKNNFLLSLKGVEGANKNKTNDGKYEK